MYRQAVGVVNLAVLQRLARKLQLVAGGENGDAHFADNVNFRDAERGQHRQLRHRQPLPGGKNGRAEGNVFARAADVLARFDAGGKTHAVVGLFGLFLHDDSVAASRNRRAGHDAHAGARRPFAAKRLTRKGFTRHRQGVTRLEIRQAYRVTVHRGVIKPRHVERGDDIACGNTAKTAHEGQRLNVMQRGNSVKHLRECRLKRHQSGGKIHGGLLRSNNESVHYGRKVRLTV